MSYLDDIIQDGIANDAPIPIIEVHPDGKYIVRFNGKEIKAGDKFGADLFVSLYYMHKTPARPLQFWTNQEGMELFDKLLKEEGDRFLNEDEKK